jgi:hypothetical protein
MNRTIYDPCAYKQQVQESVAPIHYIMDPIRYENCNKCRMELGIVGGTAVSHVAGNLVDLENDLRGANRPSTRCPSYKFQPPKEGEPLRGKEYIKPVCHPTIDTSMRHLKPCQMISYAEVPNAPQPKPFQCHNPYLEAKTTSKTTVTK